MRCRGFTDSMTRSYSSPNSKAVTTEQPHASRMMSGSHDLGCAMGTAPRTIFSAS